MNIIFDYLLKVKIYNLNNHKNMEELNINKDQLKIPELIKTYDEAKQREIYMYLNQLDNMEKKAYLIAFEHLGTSFNIYKSNGFKEWKNNNK